MDYTSFELRANSILLNGNGPKLLQKIINCPYRYDSNLQPFNLITKLEQAFIRSQENKFYKFLIECAEFLISQSFENEGIEYVKKSFVLRYLNTENTDEKLLSPEEITQKTVTVRFRTSIAFIDKNSKTLNLIFAKKRDVLSSGDIEKLNANIEQRIKALQLNYIDYKINYSIWFVEDNYSINYDYFNNFATTINNENTRFSVFYGANLFNEFNKTAEWKDIQEHIKTFKEKDLSSYLKMPNLAIDPETYKYMCEMSSSMWEKLNSDDYFMTKIRELIFSAYKDNNLTNAIKQRQNSTIESE